MRVLVVCSKGCKRQYDASDLGQGSRFHCACGETLTVPRLEGFEATVIRCSACGAPRQAGAAACKHCTAEFTLFDRDLNTVCPHCMARVGDRARFCHHCSAPLAAEEIAGEASEKTCPTCGGEVALMSRQLGNAELSLLECYRCAGMWLSAESFRVLEERAQASSAESTVPVAPVAKPAVAGSAVQYRPCPVCRKLMNRRNYGRKSGVVVDSCHQHGIWFDQEELNRILTWIRRGGLARATAIQNQEAVGQARQRRLESGSESFGPLDYGHGRRYGGFLGDLLDLAVSWDIFWR